MIYLLLVLIFFIIFLDLIRGKRDRRRFYLFPQAVCDYDANDVATGRGTVLSIDYHVQPAKKETTPSSGGRSSEKVKVSVRCQCGVYHKISF